MRVTVVGATVPAKTLRAACIKADVASKDIRVVGPRAWVQLPINASADILARLADALALGMMLVEIELPAGTPAEALQASRSTYRGVEEDISEEARGLWRDRFANRALDGVIGELAWALIGDTKGPAGEGSSAEEWAQALVAKLVADGLLELHDAKTPVPRIAHILGNRAKDLGDRLLAELIDSPAIDEVFADADQLAAAARATRPKT